MDCGRFRFPSGFRNGAFLYGIDVGAGVDDRDVLQSLYVAIDP